MPVCRESREERESVVRVFQFLVPSFLRRDCFSASEFLLSFFSFDDYDDDLLTLA